jgi:hypothetical protein
MILLPAAQHAMAVATDRSRLSIEGFPSDVMKFQGQGIVETAEGTARIVCPQALKRSLFAALAVQFNLVHFRSPLNDDAIDVLEALIVSGCDSIQRVRTGLEGVRPPRNVRHAHALELAKAGRVVCSQEGAAAGEEPNSRGA